jgi:phage-related protein
MNEPYIPRTGTGVRDGDTPVSANTIRRELSMSDIGTMDQKAITTAEDSARIAKLTSDAIRSTGEKNVEEVRKAIEEIEQKTAMLRLEADNLIEEIRKHTGNFAERVSGFVDNCANATTIFRSIGAMWEQMQKGPVNFDMHAIQSPPPDRNHQFR